MRADGWSDRERKVARRAFDQALKAFLGDRRRDIDCAYDFRYSQLTVVLAKLIQRRRLQRSDLEGLGEDKLGETGRFLELWGVDDGG